MLTRSAPTVILVLGMEKLVLLSRMVARPACAIDRMKVMIASHYASIYTVGSWKAMILRRTFVQIGAGCYDEKIYNRRDQLGRGAFIR